MFFNSSLPSPSSPPPSSPEISDFATTGIEDAELWGSGPERGGSQGGCHSCQIINQADPLAPGRMSTAGQRSYRNCTELLPGELGGAGAGGGVTWPRVPLAGPWRVRLGSNTPSPLSHIHRNPLSERRLGAVGPLRGCDPAAPHLTGCALVPLDQWPEQEPPRTRTVSGGQKDGLMESPPLPTSRLSSPNTCVAALGSLWKTFLCMGTCIICRQVGSWPRGGVQVARSWVQGKNKK